MSDDKHHDDLITLTGVRGRGFHGVLDSEKQAGQVFIVDAELSLDVSVAATYDEVNYTVDYAEVATTIQRLISGQAYDLIETLGVQIASTLLEEQPLVEHVKITVHKPQAPVPADFADVSVTIERGRAWNQ
ncbi:dihydroneopterin aldolase [Auritidibacter ignavus]|uniref:dihydroneopterin aldolase n=1 Tax=Auritidibacter ignavus TaxID=678932 RepID=UPI00109D052A|nr:dihydroneopterin aldolase [Auritidibacter ignavus]